MNDEKEAREIMSRFYNYDDKDTVESYEIKHGFFFVYF